MTALDVAVLWCLVLALCGALWGLAIVITDSGKYWRRFWHRWNWHRNSVGYMARWKGG